MVVFSQVALLLIEQESGVLSIKRLLVIIFFLLIANTWFPFSVRKRNWVNNGLLILEIHQLMLLKDTSWVARVRRALVNKSSQLKLEGMCPHLYTVFWEFEISLEVHGFEKISL